MRFIKRQTTSVRNLAGKGIHYDVNDQVILESNNVVLVPKGSTAERPANPTNGHLRYNTDQETFEGYQNGAWGKIGITGPSVITQQSLGVGDDTETVFGPLNSGDTDFPVPIAAENIIVLIENVFQLATTNYTLVQSVGGNLAGPNSPYADGWYISFGSAPVPVGKPVTVLHNFDK
jgi:hypothetical protein